MKKLMISLAAVLIAASAQAQFNMSTRGYVAYNERVLIAGFIVGTDSGFNTLVVRALGPTLAQFYVGNPVQDPNLSLYDGQGNLVALQDSYLEGTAEDLAFLQAKGLTPPDSRECALVWHITDTSYTAIVRSRNSQEGIAIVEGYFYK